MNAENFIFTNQFPVYKFTGDINGITSVLPRDISCDNLNDENKPKTIAETLKDRKEEEIMEFASKLNIPSFLLTNTLQESRKSVSSKRTVLPIYCVEQKSGIKPAITSQQPLAFYLHKHKAPNVLVKIISTEKARAMNMQDSQRLAKILTDLLVPKANCVQVLQRALNLREHVYNTLCCYDWSKLAAYLREYYQQTGQVKPLKIKPQSVKDIMSEQAETYTPPVVKKAPKSAVKVETKPMLDDSNVLTLNKDTGFYEKISFVSQEAEQFYSDYIKLVDAAKNTMRIASKGDQGRASLVLICKLNNRLKKENKEPLKADSCKSFKELKQIINDSIIKNPLFVTI